MSEVPLYQQGYFRSNGSNVIPEAGSSHTRSSHAAPPRHVEPLMVKPSTLIPPTVGGINVLEPLAFHWTNLPGQWLQCHANGSNVCRVLRPPRQQRPHVRTVSGRARLGRGINSSVFRPHTVLQPWSVVAKDESMSELPREEPREMLPRELVRLIRDRATICEKCDSQHKAVNESFYSP